MSPFFRPPSLRDALARLVQRLGQAFRFGPRGVPARPGPEAPSREFPAPRLPPPRTMRLVGRAGRARGRTRTSRPRFRGFPGRAELNPTGRLR